MKIGFWPLIAFAVAAAGVATGFLVTVQVIGPHGRSPRYGASAVTRDPDLPAAAARAGW